LARALAKARWWLFGLVAPAAFAADALTPIRTALAEGLPQIAADQARAVLRARTLDPAVRTAATHLLAEAQIALDQPAAALATLDALDDPAARLLRAHAFAQGGEWEQAREAYAAAGSPVGVAEAHQALGDTAQAIARLEPVVKSGAPVAVQLRLAVLYLEQRQPAQARQLLGRIKAREPGDKLWARYIEGRLHLLEKQPAAALATFREVLAAPAHLNDNLHAAASLGVAEARLATQGHEAADKELETFIWRHPESAWLELVFRRLDQIYAGEKNPPESELQKWAAKPPARRAALARFYVAKLQMRARKWDKALASLDAFLQASPNHRFAAYAELLRADAFLEKDALEKAVRALEAAARLAKTDAQRAEIELRTGLVHLRQREYLLAAAALDRAVERGGATREVAAYNAALAWLGQENYERAAEERARLAEFGASAELRGTLVLEEGLARARQRDPAALAVLDHFLADFPQHPRAGEARLARAEIAFLAGSLDAAEKLLRVTGPLTANAEIDDEAALLAITLADAKQPRDEAAVIQLALDFLRTRPQSKLVPDVRMKLGQIYFRQPDYPNAETQFATLARETPASPYAEGALFLAGQAAARTLNPGSEERARAHFDAVVQRNGALKLHAREQQALIQSRLGKEQEAVALYDLILEAKPAPEPDLRASALLGKGEALAALGRKAPAQLEAALATYTTLAFDETAAFSARQQALYHRAQVLEQLGRKPEAFAALHELLERNAAATQREWIWYYKAGFDAARQHEQSARWPEAIALYEKIARLEGPRAAEARDRAKQLRVEHFVWN
jgi:outer membrane protein assembly factor BamD (BamD/ComL family)